MSNASTADFKREPLQLFMAIGLTLAMLLASAPIQWKMIAAFCIPVAAWYLYLFLTGEGTWQASNDGSLSPDMTQNQEAILIEEESDNREESDFVRPSKAGPTLH